MKVSSLLSLPAAACLHLVFVGMPFKFGVLPLNLGGKLAPCERIFASADDCTPLEAFVMKDFGTRFLMHYILAGVSIIILSMKNTSNTITLAQYKHDQQQAFVSLHMRLVTMSFLNVFVMAWMQHWTSLTLDSDFFATVVIYSCLAIGVSVYATSRKESHSPDVVDMSSVSWGLPGVCWSFPGIAIFIGATVNFLVAFATVQKLVEGRGKTGFLVVHEHAPDEPEELSLIVESCLILGIVHTVLNGILLMGLRDCMTTVQQLQRVCFFKAVAGTVLPLLWSPEFSSFVNFDAKLVILVRVCIVNVYAFGCMFAGMAERVGRTLEGEKND